jgi:hypothetical protein
MVVWGEGITCAFRVLQVLHFHVALQGLHVVRAALLH